MSIIAIGPSGVRALPVAVLQYKLSYFCDYFSFLSSVPHTLPEGIMLKIRNFA